MGIIIGSEVSVEMPEYTTLERTISQLYGTEDLTIKELVNEMYVQSEDMSDMRIEIYNLLDFLNKTI